MKSNWWKFLGIILILYAIIYGLQVPIPQSNIGESMRNVFYHVGMWFAMLAIFTRSVVYSVKYLRTNDLDFDMVAEQSSRVALIFGALGLVTGMFWANFTWGKPWANDPHLNGAAISIMIYLAYFILRQSIADDYKKARVSAVYNILAFVLLVVLIGVLPRMSENTIHPGSKDGNPAFGDMDGTMRTVFYPALIGWMILGSWIAILKSRIKRIENELNEIEEN